MTFFRQLAWISFKFAAEVGVAAAVVCWPLQILWNWLIPGIFGLPALTLLQACGLWVVSCLLFKTTGLPISQPQQPAPTPKVQPGPN